MKNLAANALLLTAALLGTRTALADFTTIFTDSCLEQAGCASGTSPGTPKYYGGDGNAAAGDIIGAPSNFDILSMTVSQAGTNLVVSILTRFAEGQYIEDPNSPGNYIPSAIVYGDLMVSTTGWNPYKANPSDIYYSQDTATTSGTNWNYVVQTTTGGIYQNATLEKTYLGPGAPNDGVIREDQYVRYGSGGTLLASAAGVSINQVDVPDAVDGSTTVPGTELTYNIPLAALGLPLSSGTEVALRWAMTCANDIVEAAVSIPEPTSLSLFLGGLAGLRLLRRSQPSPKAALPG